MPHPQACCLLGKKESTENSFNSAFGTESDEANIYPPHVHLDPGRPRCDNLTARRLRIQEPSVPLLSAFALFAFVANAPGSLPPEFNRPVSGQSLPLARSIRFPESLSSIHITVLVDSTTIRIPPPPNDPLTAFEQIDQIRKECSGYLGYLQAEIPRLSAEQRLALEAARQHPERLEEGMDSPRFKTLRALSGDDELRRLDQALKDAFKKGLESQRKAVQDGANLRELAYYVAEVEAKHAVQSAKDYGAKMSASFYAWLPKIDSGLHDSANRRLLSLYGAAWAGYATKLDSHIQQVVKALDCNELDLSPALALLARTLKLQILQNYQNHISLHLTLWEQAAAIGSKRNAAVNPRGADRPTRDF